MVGEKEFERDVCVVEISEGCFKTFILFLAFKGAVHWFLDVLPLREGVHIHAVDRAIIVVGKSDRLEDFLKPFVSVSG